ncbi:MAG: HEAT repeat domain-containing protein [Acidobacteria bacterium]|nr:HEAT repeat domain-containing protein [Acidobacteriota bacterium]
MPLDDDRRLVVLARAESGAIQRFAAHSADCELDAGGRPVVWLDRVKRRESVAFLATFAADISPAAERHGHNVDGVLLALSLHAESSATPTLVTPARSAPGAHVRGQALFWLAQKAGAKVAGTILAAIQDDPDTEVKKRAVFALSRLPKDEGVPLLIGLARTNRNMEVRKQAMFWLGQSKDPRALQFFEEVLTR